MTPSQIQLMLEIQTSSMPIIKGPALRTLAALRGAGFVHERTLVVTPEGRTQLKKHFPRWEVRTINHTRYIVRPGGYVVGELYDNLEPNAFEKAINV